MNKNSNEKIRELLVTNRGSEVEAFTTGGHIVMVRRQGNDIYGNPLYKVIPKSFIFFPLECAYKNFHNKEYYLIQSYNLENDIIELLDEVDSKKPVPESWVKDASYYTEKGYILKHVIMVNNL